MTKRFQNILSSQEFNLRGIFISRYIPRRCGLATYTKDLSNAINILNPNFLTEIMAVDDPTEVVEYPWEVKYRIQREREEDYLKAADYINKSSCDYVSIQHEYGIYGGSTGCHVLTLLRNIKKPIITTFHTTLEFPNDEQKYILQQVARASKACIVMIEEAKRRLIHLYNVSPGKIAVIAHGVPNIPFSPAENFKEQIGFHRKDFLIGSINLIAPNKGLEYVVRALPKIREIEPNVKFLMIGQTHPSVLAYEGEKYRKKIKHIVRELGVEKQFVEIDQYISLERLTDYLKALDIYITPYKDMNATSSGTLAYALGAGKVCISTPYIYAKEVLNSERGILIKPQSSAEITRAVKKVIMHPDFREELEQNAYTFGRRMVWEKVALDYLNLFSYVVTHSASRKAKA